MSRGGHREAVLLEDAERSLLKKPHDCMSKIQWEYDLVERSIWERLKAMGWQWIEGNTDAPEFTERQNFREILPKGRLTATPAEPLAARNPGSAGDANHPDGWCIVPMNPLHIPGS